MTPSFSVSFHGFLPISIDVLRCDFDKEKITNIMSVYEQFSVENNTLTITWSNELFPYATKDNLFEYEEKKVRNFRLS